MSDVLETEQQHWRLQVEPPGRQPGVQEHVRAGGGEEGALQEGVGLVAEGVGRRALRLQQASGTGGDEARERAFDHRGRDNTLRFISRFAYISIRSI